MIKWFFGIVVVIGLIGAIIDPDSGEETTSSDPAVVSSVVDVTDPAAETVAPLATTPTPEISQPPPVLFPDGYRQVSAEFAMKSVKKGEPGWDCESYDYCVNWNLYSIFGCPNGGYVEANILEASGTIVSYSNDLIPQMNAGDIYRTVLGGFGDGGMQFQLTDITCN